MKKKIFGGLFFTFLTLFCFSQTGSVKGFVYEANSGEPIGFAMLHIQNSSYGSVSDRNGSFIINSIPFGKYVIEISNMGHEVYYDTIVISSSNIIIKKYMLKISLTSLDEVKITAEGFRNVQETRTSVISITPKDMAKMPSIGGQPDFAQYLQILPGIVSTGDQGGQLYIRGGAPAQNFIFLDGAVIFNPFHSIGLFSVFDADIMSSTNIYSGGFGAEFGGRMSAVMDIQTRSGNKKRFAGKVDINTFGAKILLEGPFVKMSDKNKGSFSYLLSAKGSYLEHSSKVFYPYLKEILPYTYLDLYGKLSVNAQNGTHFNFFGFRFDDKMNYSKIANYKWNNWGIGTNFLVIPGAVPTTIEGTIFYTNYIVTLQEMEDKLKEKKSTIDGFTANLKFNYYVGKNVLNAGFEMLGYNTLYSVYGDNENFTTDIGLFAKFKYNFRNKLLIEPSFRLQAYFSINSYSPEPRLSMKWNITKNVRLKLAGGLYSQNFASISSDQDVVNFFYGYTTSVSTTQLESRPDYKTSIQKAQHAILGLEIDALKYTNINIEGYYKHFDPIISANRYQLVQDILSEPIPGYSKYNFLWETGHAYGGDITVKFERRGVYIWGVYSLGWITRNDGTITYLPHFDRRHNVNILVSYSFGKRSSWQADMRWNYGSGFPFTQTKTDYPNYTPVHIDDDYIHQNESLDFVLADINKGRLPNYHRLDVSIKKKFFLGERQAIEIALSATNVYNYKNIFYVNRLTNDKIYQLPILYNIGFSWNF